MRKISKKIKNLKSLLALAALSLVASPVSTAFAQTTTDEGIAGLVKKVNRYLINPLIAFMFAAALAYFIWGVVEFLAGASSEDARSKGKQHMLWGIVGMAIMMSVFGIMQLIINTLGVTGINPRG